MTTRTVDKGPIDNRRPLAEYEVHFQCALCHRFFMPGWTAEEAEAEYRDKFGYLPEELFNDRDVVCDDCWKKAGFDIL